MTRTRFTRRVFIGGTLATVTALSLTGCVDPAADILIVEDDGQYFSAEQLTLLSEVSEIMIPRTDTPGAIDAQVPAVVDAMMVSWAVEDTRKQFERALKEFDERADGLTGDRFVELQKKEREAIVFAMDSEAFSDTSDNSAGEDYRRLKELIFRVFYTSEEASADLVPIPGQYEGNLTLAEYDNLMRERAIGA